ncbi:hypothetical protein [Niabella ginsenosidivorans]|uniref:hypothetical protein n=1 Tax=Niabella ginsenosidivorans TaxID=1176587 RepID=UPI001471E262|nr:hypothetical protein [Niabella ginsenosidivorans]
MSDSPEEYGMADTLNEELARQLRLANDVVSYAIKENIPNVVTFTKETYYPGFDPATLEEKAIFRRKN